MGYPSIMVIYLSKIITTRLAANTNTHKQYKINSPLTKPKHKLHDQLLG